MDYYSRIHSSQPTTTEGDLIQTIFLIERNGLALAVLALIYVYMRIHSNKHLVSHNLFSALIVTNTAIIIFDMLFILLSGRYSLNAIRIRKVFTAVYYSLIVLLSALWLLYVDFYINKDKVRLRRKIVAASIPLFLNTALSFISVKWNIMFYIDSSGIYHRGKYFFVMVAISFVFILYAAFYTTLKRVTLQRKELFSLYAFALPPTIGGIVETLYPGVTIIWMCTTFSLLLVFMNLQNDLLKTDYLTGLFNRRQLDAYLRVKAQGGGLERLAGIMIDLDSFKEINDTYGHDAGDRALVYMADILARTFRKNDFIARYGGDEFVVIMESGSKEDVERAIRRLNNNMQRFNSENQLPFKLEFSAGYDSFKSLKMSGPELIRYIDNLMYKNKHK